jgi:hypothetical protein
MQQQPQQSYQPQQQYQPQPQYQPPPPPQPKEPGKMLITLSIILGGSALLFGFLSFLRVTAHHSLGPILSILGDAGKPGDDIITTLSPIVATIAVICCFLISVESTMSSCIACSTPSFGGGLFGGWW